MMTMTAKEIEEFLSEPEVTTTEEVVYSSTGKPHRNVRKKERS